jgi:hypothetical protein
MDERALAYKRLRAAVHRLLCGTHDVVLEIDTHKTRGVLVRTGKLNALDRALKISDALEGNTADEAEDDASDADPSQ